MGHSVEFRIYINSLTRTVSDKIEEVKIGARKTDILTKMVEQGIFNILMNNKYSDLGFDMVEELMRSADIVFL